MPSLSIPDGVRNVDGSVNIRIDPATAFGTDGFQRPRSPSYADPELNKLMEAREKKRDMEDLLEGSYSKLAPFGYNPEMCKRQRKGKYFTDDDLPATKALFDKHKEEKRLKELHECWDKAYEAERWADLREAWEKDKQKPKESWHWADPEEDEPGIFHVSQKMNNGYETYSDFVVIARSEAEARRTHPGYPSDSFTYQRSELERHEEWKASGKRGPAPAWFLGDYDSWCHGAWCTVKRISDYKPPRGENPEYGIVSSSFHAG